MKHSVTPKDYGTEVKLLAMTVPIRNLTGESSGDPLEAYPGTEQEELIEYAGRLCYNAEGKTGTKPGWIQERIQAGHESMIEHCSATFLVTASRAFTHELVRHRLASYSQRSQRCVKEDKAEYIIPPELPGDLKNYFREAMESTWRKYRALLDSDVKPEIARYVLPNACMTKIVVTMNFRELRHFIKLRTSEKAPPEMREVAGKTKEICKVISPEVFEDV